MDNLLTVVVPVFNDAANITRCLKSLFNQTFKFFEIIVINDASTDDTAHVLNACQQEHPFSVIHLHENLGAGECRNIGIQAAHTPYVTFVDSDDWVDISTYENCFKHSGTKPDVIIYGLSYDFVTQNRREKKYCYTKTYKMSGDFALSIYAHTIPNEIRITPIVNNKIYRKTFLTDHNLVFHKNIRYQEDDAFTFEVLARAKSVILVDGCSYHYCQRVDSMIHKVSELSIHDFFAAYLALEENLKLDDLFEKNKDAYYLKLKSSLLGVIKRVIEYEPDVSVRNKLINLLLSLLVEKLDVLEILNTFDFSSISSIL